MSRYMGNFARPENAIKRAVRRAMERDRGTRGRPGGGASRMAIARFFGSRRARDGSRDASWTRFEASAMGSSVVGWGGESIGCIRDVCRATARGWGVEIRSRRARGRDPAR